MSQSEILAIGSQSEQLSETILRAVADAEGLAPAALDTPLYESINPEALDRLFRSPNRQRVRTGCVQFEYCGYEVEIHADGQLTLTER